MNLCKTGFSPGYFLVCVPNASTKDRSREIKLKEQFTKTQFVLGLFDKKTQVLPPVRKVYRIYPTYCDRTPC